MLRTLLLVAAFGLFGVVSAQEKKPARSLHGSVADRELEKEKPESGVIVSTKGWQKLAKAWGIKDEFKVDFEKEILIVVTTHSTGVQPAIEFGKGGDLQVKIVETKLEEPGFRYSIARVRRDLVKTVNGKELPKE
ncbi:MAG TPA: hypothetical protein VKE74_29610 [Gemmataceae bacterium]|nr:hypothetical protein [Gemmataceae bacterium]